MKTLSTIIALLLTSVVAFAQSAPKKPEVTNRISMNVTVAKQTQGTTFGEKVNQGLQSAGSAVANGVAKSDNPLYEDKGNDKVNPLFKQEVKVASPGQPIGGIVVKGGKNKTKSQ